MLPAAFALLLAVADSAGTLSLQPCLDPALAGGRCGTYTVWENRLTRRGRTIPLQVVVLGANGPEPPQPDALFVLAGGPGQGAAELAPVLAERWAFVRRTRDVVFVDQRGTGASNGLRCDPPVGVDTLAWLMREMVDLETIRQCRPGLERRADLTQYTTAIAMDDLDELRAALGYERINLQGGSYGTRAALVYARQHPTHVRTVLLESVASVDMKLPLTFGRDAQLALAGLARDCQSDEACARAFPDPEADLARALRRFDGGPLHVTMTRPNGMPTDLVLERGWFAEALRYALYTPETASRLPLYLHRAADGDFEPIVRFGLANRAGLWQQISLGMFLTVTCAEDIPFISDADVPRWSSHTWLGDYRIAQQRRACREWPRAPLPAGYRDPVRSSVPVLLVAGEFDPATSSLLAHQVARTLSRGRVLVVPHAGHNGSGLVNAGCVSRLEDTFIERGSSEELDDWCLRDVRRPPFATALPTGTPPG